jgi:hypothetical protein
MEAQYRQQLRLYLDRLEYLACWRRRRNFLRHFDPECKVSFGNDSLWFHSLKCSSSDIFCFLPWIPGISHSARLDGGDGACDDSRQYSR